MGMQDEEKINRILAQLEDIKQEVKAMLPRPKPAPVVKTVPDVKPVTLPKPAAEAAVPQLPKFAPDRPACVYEPTLLDRFWEKFEDWFCVRGDFAPKGMTREFAVATRWLTRVGAVLLVGAIAYFLMLAIDKGWIGPTQRVYGMMTWGVVGTAFGVWLKLKSEKYSILGEVCAAVGLVAAYLSFGLGHRYFDPPVIESGYFAFAGLFAATLEAGVLSVRLRSLMIACLALAGGFLVPTICSFTSHDVQLHLYLVLLSSGACAVAHFRKWTIYAFAAIAVALLFSQGLFPTYGILNAHVAYAFWAFEFSLAVAVTVSQARSEAGRSVCWAASTLAGIFTLCKMSTIVGVRCSWHGAVTLHYLAWTAAFTVLACLSRRRNWGGTPVLMVFACVCAAFALGSACIMWWDVNFATVMFLFCAFAALLAELGVRSREKTLQVLSLICVVALSIVSFSFFVTECSVYSNWVVYGYARGLVDRIQYLWSVPALVAFVGWRLGAPGLWMEKQRVSLFAIASGMAFFVLTAESHFFGHEYLPFLRGGFVTIVWAILASSLLAVGIVRRLRAARLTGLGILSAAVLKLLIADTASLATPGRVGVFAAVGVLLIAAAFLYLKFRTMFEAADEEVKQPVATC